MNFRPGREPHQTHHQHREIENSSMDAWQGPVIPPPPCHNLSFMEATRGCKGMDSHQFLCSHGQQSLADGRVPTQSASV